jgi:hypothetical protein
MKTSNEETVRGEWRVFCERLPGGRCPRRRVTRIQKPGRRGHPMPLGFDLHPAAMLENSQMFQHWERGLLQEPSVAKARLIARFPIFSPPFGTGALLHSSPNVETLGFYRMSLPDCAYVAFFGIFRLQFPSANPGGIGRDAGAPKLR